MWLFAQALMISPLVTAVDKLTVSIDKSDVRNNTQHNMIVDKLDIQDDRSDAQDKRIGENEVRLFRVVDDCKDNGDRLDVCRRLHPIDERGENHGY